LAGKIAITRQSTYNVHMHRLSARNILTLFLFAALFQACGTSDRVANTSVVAANRVTEKENRARTNVEELGMLVNVPYDAEEVAWKENEKEKRVIAVLRFSNADVARIIADAEKVRQPEAAVIQCEAWFPAELIAQGEMSGDDTLKGTAYAANTFLQEPYSAGRITHIENTAYFVLDVSAK
jgi:hypothetical protein